MNASGLVLLFLAAARPAAAQADREVVRVDGVPIRQSEVLDRLWKRYGPETLEEMVDELLLRQAAARKKVKAAPAEIERRLSNLKSQFADPRIFENQLKQYGSSLDKLKDEIADQLVREKLVISELGLSVKDEEVKKSFAEHKDELGTPEGVRLRHILVKTEAEAKELAVKVSAGADFAALAREKSLAPTGKLSGGDYGFVSKGMLPPDIEKIAFSLKPNELKIFPSDKGVHLLQALERRKAVAAEYGKVKEDLREMLLQEKLKQALPEFLKGLRQKADIKPAAAP